MYFDVHVRLQKLYCNFCQADMTVASEKSSSRFRLPQVNRMMCIVVCGQWRHPPPKRPSHQPRLVMSFPFFRQVKGIMRPKRTLQKSIRNQISINMLERLFPQSCTADVERSKPIRMMMLELSCGGVVYASLKRCEGKNDAYDRFRKHLQLVSVRE